MKLYIIPLLLISYIANGQTIYSDRVKAEYDYGLYDSILLKAGSMQTSQDSLYLAYAYLYTGSFIESAELARGVVEDQHEALLVLSKSFSNVHAPDSACFYLDRYLSGSDLIPRAEILLDSSFQKIEHSGCWKQLWRKEYYAVNEVADEYQRLLNAENYNAILEKFYSSPQSIYIYYKAKAFIGLGQLKDAERVLAEARTKDQLQLKWELQCQMGKYKDALETANTLEDRYHYSYENCKRQGVSMYLIGQAQGASSKLEEYLDVYYMDVEAICLLAKVYALQGRYLDALRVSNKAFIYDQASSSAFLVRGDVFYELENWDFATKAYHQYLDINSRDAEAYLKLGKVYLKNGNVLQACRELQFAKLHGSIQSVELSNRYCSKK